MGIDWGLGIGDWGFGVLGVGGLGPTTQPQPQTPPHQPPKKKKKYIKKKKKKINKIL